MSTIKIGTRGSKLALAQANFIAEFLADKSNLKSELVIIKTTGDIMSDVPLANMGGKEVFVKELETALLSGAIDLAVHSLKDLPSRLPDGLLLGAITKREDSRDCVISRFGERLGELVKGAFIGTSSLRRQAQLLAYRPDFHVEPLRGNLDTRIRKLREGACDAIVVSSAGVRRLGLESEITELLDCSRMLPAPGQGTLGIEIKDNNPEVAALIQICNDPATSAICRAERAFLDGLGGGCQVPIGAYAIIDGETLCLEGLVGDPDGKRVLRDKFQGSVSQPEFAGYSLAEKLLNEGASEILLTL